MNKKILFLSFLIVSCAEKKQSAQQHGAGGPMPVSITDVPEEVVTVSRTYPGTIVPLNETEIYAEVNGYITGMLVQDGAFVKKGQALYEIDRMRYQAALDQARADLSIAQANLTKVTRDAERYKRLFDDQAIAKQTYDNSLTDMENAHAQVSSAKASVTTANLNYDRAVIRAPFDGVIGISKVRNGALVTPGSTLINTISSIDPIAVDFTVSENDIAFYRSLVGKTNLMADSAIILKTGNNKYYKFPGYISAIDRAANSATGTMTVRAVFKNPDEELSAGVNATLFVKNTTNGKVPLIPYKAVSEQLGEFTVFVVTDSNTVNQTPVKLGMKVGDKVIVQDGLKAGEKIVVDGTQNLRTGAKVMDQSTMADQNKTNNASK